MDNFFARLFNKREATSGVITTTDPTDASNQPASGGNWDAKVVRPGGRQSLLVPAWYRGVSLIMQTMGQMVVQYQRMSPEGGNFIEDKGHYDLRNARMSDGGRLNYLLQVRPNPLMPASVMQEQIEYRKIYYGNALVYIERDEFDWPKYLWLCTGGSYNRITNCYTITYNSLDGIVCKFVTPARNILHFRNVFLDDDFFTGIPTIRYAMKTLSIAATADEMALSDVAKGGRHKVLLQENKETPVGTRGRANRQALKDMRNQFADDWAANDVVLLDNVADAKIISQTSQQLQLLEQRNFEVNDLARILGVPLIMMMVSGGGAYTEPAHATQEFLLRTIQPRIREHEDEYNSKILGESDFGSRRIHVCEKALRRLDAKGQAEIDDIHLRTGWSANEIRSQYDLPTIEGGDAHYVSTNLAEVGSEKLRAASGGSSNDGQKSGEGEKK